MATENYTAEAVGSAGAIFATHVNSDSAHVPLGKLVWGGDTATFNQTSTSAPFPVQLFGSGGLDSTSPVFPANNSAHPIFVRGTNADSSVPVTGTVVVSVVSTISSYGVVHDSVNSALRVNVVADAQAAQSSATGALSEITLTLSSVAQTVMTASGRLYGYSLSNPDTADNAWILVYPDDSAGVTLGTSSAQKRQMVPFGGGREAYWNKGIFMSSGMSVTAAATAASTAHDTPAATITATLYYAPST